jgi:16S rRNA (guanine1207-N2)-methyltransferase
LLAAAAVQTHERVLDLGMAGLPVGLDLSAGGIHFVSPDLRAVRRCENMIRRRALGNACAWLETSPADVTGPCFDVGFYAPARWEAKARVFQLIDAAFHKTAIHGRLLLAGRLDAGVKSYRNRLKAVFGCVEKVTAKSGFRIYRSYKRRPESGVDPVNPVHSFVVNDLCGSASEFESCAGVFSSAGLDPGTRFLIETADVKAQDRVLDLGCGYGAVGIAAGQRAREVLLLDSDLLAVRCARRNIARSRLTNARVALSDGFEAASGRSFDLILCNAPTHQGTATARLFTHGATRQLEPEGRFVVVAMRPGMYRKQMKRSFDAVEELGSRLGYTILGASRPKAGTPAD